MSTKHLNVNQFSFELALNVFCCDILIIFQLIKHACQIMNYYFTNILQHKTNLNKSCVATLIVVQDKKGSELYVCHHFFLNQLHILWFKLRSFKWLGKCNCCCTVMQSLWLLTSLQIFQTRLAVSSFDTTTTSQMCSPLTIASILTHRKALFLPWGHG